MKKIILSVTFSLPLQAASKPIPMPSSATSMTNSGNVWSEARIVKIEESKSSQSPAEMNTDILYEELSDLSSKLNDLLQKRDAFKQRHPMILDIASSNKMPNDLFGYRLKLACKLFLYACSIVAGSSAVGALIGTIPAPGYGTAIGAFVGGLIGTAISKVIEMYASSIDPSVTDITEKDAVKRILEEMGDLTPEEYIEEKEKALQEMASLVRKAFLNSFGLQVFSALLNILFGCQVAHLFVNLVGGRWLAEEVLEQ
ncbi:MAG: hypothetical protein AAF335_02905 [Bacteroidota bacterium]